jgi:hypothetical protein
MSTDANAALNSAGHARILASEGAFTSSLPRIASVNVEGSFVATVDTSTS